MDDGPQTLVWTSSLKCFVGTLMRSLGMGRCVAQANMQVSQGDSCEFGSSSISQTAPLSTNLRAVSTEMWPRQQWSSIAVMSSAVSTESEACTTL
jgi:hypothetical protein